MANTLFWTNVNNRLKEMNITQEKMCFEIGLSINTVRGWVSKDVLPRVDDAVSIALFLHTSAEYLVTGKDDPRIEEVFGVINDLSKGLDALIKGSGPLRLSSSTLRSYASELGLEVEPEQE